MDVAARWVPRFVTGSLVAALIVACAPSSSAPGPTATSSGGSVAPTAAVTTPTAPPPSPTATIALGLTRYTNTELGYSLDLPAGWRRADCSAGVVATSPLVASEIFLGVPETEEHVTGGARMVIVQVSDAHGLTPQAWLQQSASQPDVRFEPVTLGGRPGARAFVGATGVTYALAFAARGWIYGIERPYFGAEDEELRRIIGTLQILNDATLGRGATPTPMPRSIETLVDAIADAFARKDLTALAETMTPCITAGAVPGDAAMLSRAAYLTSLAAEFSAGTSVVVQSRPIENDPNLGRFVRSTWSKVGEPDRRVDLRLRAQGDRWSLSALLFRAPGN
jgi:hypothetical protein